MQPDYEYKSCLKKRLYKSRRLARKWLKKGKRKGYLKREHEIYRCAFCAGWHIGRWHDGRPKKIKEEIEE